MNGKTLAITGVLTLGLLAPAGTAIAATTDNDGPLGGVLGGLLGGNDDNDNRKEKRKKDRRNVTDFRFSGEIRSFDRDDREIKVDLGDKNRWVRVAKGAKIWRDGDRATFRELRRGDDVRVSGEKRNGRWVADRVVAD